MDISENSCYTFKLQIQMIPDGIRNVLKDEVTDLKNYSVVFGKILRILFY